MIGRPTHFPAALRAAATAIRATLGEAWAALRSIAGDDAYERYLVHHATCHVDAPPLDRQAYYLDRQRKKWDGVQRCC